jgi:hypothetical protein
MFDAKAEFHIQARTAGAGIQAIGVRFPTDAEWVERARRRKVLIRRLGRGASETVPAEPGEADARLYEAIKLNGSPALTPAESARILETLATCDVTGVSIEGETAVVDMQIVTGEAKHRFTIPTADQVLTMRRAAVRVVDLPYNVQEVRITPEAGARLYDQLHATSDGYDGPVPGPHKDAAVRASIEFIERELGPKPDDANF